MWGCLVHKSCVTVSFQNVIWCCKTFWVVFFNIFESVICFRNCGNILITFVFEYQQQKLQEQALQQLHEQLQMNTIQQTQLLQQATAPSIVGSGDKGKGSSKAVQQQLQTLAVQQQQLVQQIQHLQLQQRHYLLACLVQPFGMPQGRLPCPGDISAYVLVRELSWR